MNMQFELHNYLQTWESCVFMHESTPLPAAGSKLSSWIIKKVHLFRLCHIEFNIQYAYRCKPLTSEFELQIIEHSVLPGHRSVEC